MAIDGFRTRLTRIGSIVTAFVGAVVLIAISVRALICVCRSSFAAVVCATDGNATKKHQ